MNYIESNEPVDHFRNKLTILKEKLDFEPDNSILLRGLSDPPTTTLQRLMAIMTGALPTLVDAGSNFASAALKEDNFLTKLLNRGERVVSIGDDTWDKLYPSMMNESYYYPSFDVWDLHTLDRGVRSHLFPLLNQKNHDWSLCIAHFLGVDHAGHRYGPGHVAMGDKLVEMNQDLEKIFDLIHEDTLVIVMGDHGMDSKGDHGGDSFPEMDAGLFFYSKKTLFPRSKINIINSINDQLGKIDGYEIFSQMYGARTVQQIDLVSSISILMGLEIPFGNLGTLIPELFVKDGIRSLLDLTRENALQVQTYLVAYCEKRPDAINSFSHSRVLFQKAESSYSLLEDTANDDRILEIYLEYILFLRQTLIIARNIWSRFEPVLMFMGILILALTTLFSIIFMKFECIIPFEYIIGSLILGVLGYFAPISRFVYRGMDMLTLTVKPFHEMLFFSSIGLLTILYTNIQYKPESKKEFNIIEDVLLALYVASIGSDSFLIFEDFVLLHFLQFIHACLFLNLWKSGRSFNQILLVVICAVAVRIISTVTICRPDQGPYCVATFYSSANSSIASANAPLATFAAVAVAIWMNFRNNSISKRFSTIFAISTICSTSYWTLDTLENHEILPNTDIPKATFLIGYWLTAAFICVNECRKNRQVVPPTIFMILLLFQKPMGQFTLTLFFIYTQVFNMIQSPGISPIFLLGQLLFFTTGHQNQLPSIQYDVGFIGLSKANYAITPVYVLLNTFAGQMMSISFTKNIKRHLITMSILLTTSIFFCAWFSRHSQAFRVWGPKFLFVTVSHVITSGLAILLLLLNQYDEKYKVE
jgi:phosphatidylinositol glycan class O